MKGSAIARIVIWSLVAIFLIGILVTGILFSSDIFDNFPFGFSNSYNYKNEESYTIGGGAVDAAEISDIEINWVSGSVTVEPSNGDKIEFSEDGTYSENDRMRYTVSNGQLIIQFRKSGRFKTSVSKNLTVRIPENTTVSLNSIDIDSISANTYINGARPNETSISSTSGDITVKNMECHKLSVETVSGKTKLTYVTADELSVESVSGDCTASGTFTEIDTESISGNVELMSASCPREIECETVSGNIRVTIPDNNGFTASLDTVSGDLQCNFEATVSKKLVVYGDGSAKFEFETVSGDVDIYKDIAE